MQLVYSTSGSYYTGAMSEQGDSSSAEEVESPRSVVTAAVGRKSGGVGGRWRRWRKRCANNNKNYNNNNNSKSEEKEKEKEKEKERCYLHSQVLRVKEEELQIGEYLMGHFGIFNINYVPDSNPVDVVDDDDSGSKMVLPASPLGSKKNY